MNPWPSPRAGGASARRLRTRGPAAGGDAFGCLARARGGCPLVLRVRDGSPKGRDKRSGGSVYNSPPLAHQVSGTPAMAL